MTARLLLVRHGRTAWNASGRFQGQADVPLDSVGETQASSVASALAAALVEVPVAAVVTSDLARAAVTAQPVGTALGVAATVDPRLREIFLGSWQGLSAAEAQAAFPAEYDQWQAGVDVRRGGGENYADVAARAGAWVGDALAAYPTGLVIAVTHGGTARALTGSLIGLPVPMWSALGPLGNCRVVALGLEGDRWRLLAWNAGELAGLKLG